MARFTSPLHVCVGGTLLALLVALAAVIFMNPPQCPQEYTQAQVDASNCIVGANIGLGLALLLAGLIEVVSMAVAVVLLVTARRKLR